MLYFYSQIGINLKFVTSNNPLSVIFISGITGNDKNDNIKKGLKSILDEIAFSEECKLFKSEITSFDEREVIIQLCHHLFLVLILKLSLLRLGKFIFLDKSFCKFKLLVLSKSLLFCITNLPFL